MRGQTLGLRIVPVILAAYVALGTSAVQPQAMAPDAPLSALWEQPHDLRDQDLFNGPWGAARAPDPDAVYSFLRLKTTGTNPGVVVQDPAGREWHVKQPPHNDHGEEGPVEVTVSRVLSAVGYHQPPVYFLPSFMMRDATGTRRVPGGRFRLHDGTMHSRGPWLWQRNPFIGTQPFQGLLVILLAFNSFDLKSSNNSVYDVQLSGGRTEQWYVVRDLGAALGESARLGPTRNDPGRFERQTFITGIRDGFVTFSYHGWHPELFRGRIVPADLEWAATLLSGLSDRQWDDAFRAGGFTPAVAGRYLRKLRANIARAQQFSNAPTAGAVERR
jgi:hypothetical protein